MQLKLRFWFVAVVVALLSVFFVPRLASADSIIYDGGGPGGFQGVAADTSSSYPAAAESFVLSPGATTITDAEWWGYCGLSNDLACPQGDFTIGFYTSLYGLGGVPVAPDTLIAQFDVGNANQTPTGNSVYIGPLEYEYTAAFSSVSLTAGTTYWFVISNTTDGDYWSWEQVTNESGFYAQYYGSGWDRMPGSLAFNLTGPVGVPEPSSVLLLGMGVMALVGGGIVAAQARSLEQAAHSFTS